MPDLSGSAVLSRGNECKAESYRLAAKQLETKLDHKAQYNAEAQIKKLVTYESPRLFIPSVALGFMAISDLHRMLLLDFESM